MPLGELGVCLGAAHRRPSAPGTRIGLLLVLVGIGWFATLTPHLLLVWPLPYDAVARMVDAVQLIMGAAVLVVWSRSDEDLVCPLRADRLGAVRGGRDRTATEHNARCHR